MDLDPEFLAKLREAFRGEATEQLQSICSSLIAIARSPEETPRHLELMLRNFHSLKGSARPANMRAIERSCQQVESLVIQHRKEGRPLANDQINYLHDIVDTMLYLVQNMDSPSLAPAESKLLELVEELERMDLDAAGEGDSEAKPPLTLAPPPSDGGDEPVSSVSGGFPTVGGTVRIPVGRLDDHVQVAEELVYAKLMSEQRYIDCGELQSIMGQWARRWQRMRPEIENEMQKQGDQTASFQLPDRLRAGALQDFVDLHDSFVGKMQEKLAALERSVVSDRRTVDTLVDSLLDSSRELTMVPFSVLNDLLEKIVWDLGREQGKDISLLVQGSEVQIDRHILDELRDPLIHLIRNCVDHGIERSEDRLKSGKSAGATIELRLAPVSSGKVEIVVRDDGRGIDPQSVKRAAVAQGFISQERADDLADHEATALIFRSSFSTKGTVSEISGRGLGLSIVKEKLEQLGGSVDVSSRAAVETRFRLTVPVRRATMVAITASVGRQTVVIPTASIRAAVRTRDQDVRLVEGRWTMTFNERLLPMINLAGILHLDSELNVEDAVALVVGSNEYPIALLVDEVAGEQEVAVKNLPPPLTRVRNIGGATLLKTGDLAVVVNMNDVLTSAVLVGAMVKGREGESHMGPGDGARGQSQDQSQAQKVRRILVVEDSITSRVLLKNILESAGYAVVVANDGLDGWNKFNSEPFDLVISDVEMPRMTGFELTRKIRRESGHPDIPIIVVTSLASLEDRRRGVEVGASAYFVKSNFEKANLLDMVKRLL